MRRHKPQRQNSQPVAAQKPGQPVAAQKKPGQPVAAYRSPKKAFYLAYAIHYLDSDVIYFLEVSEVVAQQHRRQYGCEPLVVEQVVVQKGSHGWTANQQGWKPVPGNPVDIEFLFKVGLN